VTTCFRTGLPRYPDHGMRSIAVCGTVAALALLLTSTSCGVAPTVESGVVQGTLEAVGGPGPGTARPLKGSIALRDSDGTVFSATAAADGVFLVRVPIGIYAITGRSPVYESGDVDCVSSGLATLTVDATIHVVVVCSER
jgi:hypothetical protein